MFGNYIKTAIRNLIKHKGYSFINIFGLAIGIACSILMYFFIKSELTYDQFHSDYQRIYRVGMGINFQGLEYWDTTPYPLADAMVREIPGVEFAARFTKLTSKRVQFNGDPIKSSIHLVGPAFFDIFDFPIKAGNAQAILADRNSVIISERLWQQYFGKEEAIGEILSVETQNNLFENLRIAAIAKKIPDNSSIKFDILASEQLFSEIYGDRSVTAWFPKTSTVTFFKTNLHADVAEIENGLQGFSDRHNLTSMLRLEDVNKKFLVENLADVHFSDSIPNRFLEANGDPAYSFILAGVALLVLLIACINFMNLSLGLSKGRMSEVGVRKVCGARRPQLMRQFWTESIVMSCTALLFGLLLASLFLPTFNSLSGKAIEVGIPGWETAGILLMLAFLVGLISGSYPALMLSGLIPAKIFRGSHKLGGKNNFSRLMIIFQFALSVFLISGTMVMSYQLSYVSRMNLGLKTEYVIYHNLTGRIGDDTVERYRHQATQIPGVLGVTAIRGSLTGDSPSSMWLVSFEGQRLQLPAVKVDYDFLDVMDIDLIAGRNFSRDMHTDPTGAIIVNERFVKKFSLSDPVGQEAPLGGQENPVIIGVVKDFHFMSARKFIEPMVLNLRPDSDNDQLFTRIKSENIDITLEQLGESWRSLVPDMPFDYSFFEGVIENQYRAEQNFKRIATYSSYFAIAIACLGLFGLTSLSITSRTKEIGIRKVFGASILRILNLFNKELVLLIVIANVLSWPVAWLAMTHWLRNFSYRIDMEWWMLVVAGGLTFVLAIMTVSARAARAALANPVDSLRYE